MPLRSRHASWNITLRLHLGGVNVTFRQDKYHVSARQVLYIGRLRHHPVPALPHASARQVLYVGRIKDKKITVKDGVCHSFTVILLRQMSALFRKKYLQYGLTYGLQGVAVDMFHR